MVIIKNLLTKMSHQQEFCQIFFGPVFNGKKNKKNFKRNYEILEVGCGDGKYGKLLKKIIGRNFKSYLGIDIKKENVGIIVEKI